MDEGVAYMVMGEGGEMTQVTQPTQVVAIDQGDGTQQFAIPVIDPETGQVSCHWPSHGHVTTLCTQISPPIGQETYMIIDPETAHNITNGAAVVMDSGAGAATAAEVN